MIRIVASIDLGFAMAEKTENRPRESIMEQWEHIYTDVIELSKLERQQGRSERGTMSAPDVQARLVLFCTVENLTQLWIDIASNQSVNYSRHIAQQLFRAHRVLANMYQAHQEAIPIMLQHDAYMKLLADSYIAAMGRLHSASCRALATLLNDIGVQARHAVALSLCHCDNATQKQRVCSYIDTETALEMIATLHRLPLKANIQSTKSIQGHVEDRGSSAFVVAVYDTVQILLSHVVAAVVSSTEQTTTDPTDSTHRLISVITHKLLLQQPSTCRMACLVVSCLLTVTTPLLVDLLQHVSRLVGHMWSEVTFVSRGDITAHNYVTVALLRLLQHLDRDALLSMTHPPGPDKDPAPPPEASLLSIISRGVSIHLNSAERLTRVNGMRVAVALSEVLTDRGDGGEEGDKGCVVHFDDLDAFTEDVYGNLHPRSTAEREGKGGENKTCPLPTTTSPPPIRGPLEGPDDNMPRDDVHDSDDDSDDDSLVAFYLDEVGGRRVDILQGESNEMEPGVKLCYYLRECLSCKCDHV